MAKHPKHVANRHQRRAAGPSGNLLPIFVDPSFTRTFADQAIVLALGHDVDLAFVASGPRLDHMSRQGDRRGSLTKMTPSYFEVARVRMPPAGATMTAMAILRSLTENGFINKAEMLKAIAEFDEPAVEADEGDSNEVTPDED
jgi:hypothetical protein